MTRPSWNSPGVSAAHEQLLDTLHCLLWVLDFQGNITFVNQAFVAHTQSAEALASHTNITAYLPAAEQFSAPSVHDALRGQTPFTLELEIPVAGEPHPFELCAQPGPQLHSWVATLRDLSPQKQAELARQKQAQQLETLNRVNQTISAELDVQKVVQAVTDAGVELTGAQFGAFFYTLPDHNGSLLNLYALSGAPPEAFAHYPMPHMTAVFGPTFRNEGVVRSDDITQDALYGQNAPYHGMLPGHLPVRSYLAVPVVTREGTAIGGFFFGHPEAGIFNDTAERAALSLATQAAIALNNAQLYQTARHSERRFRSLVEATSQIVWNRASTGEVIVEQPAWQNFTGQTAEQQLGWGWLDAIHPDDRERTQLAWKQAVNTQALYRVEHRLRRHDGAYRFMRARATPVRNEDGTLLEWVGVHEDITEHHEAEQRLREREARYRALVEYTIVGVTRIDLNGHFIDVNPAAAAFLGYSQAELAGMSVKDVTYPPDLNESFAALQTVISGERAAVTLEKRYVRKNREIVWSNSGVTVVRGADGEPQYLIAVISNITERKHAEAELHRLNADLESRVRERTQDLAQERSFLRALLESLAEGIAVCDEHGQLTLFNDSAVRIVGLPAESLPPSEWASHYGVYHPDGITLLATEELPLLRALQGEDVRDVPIIIDTEDRPRRFVSISGNVIRGESGEKLGAVVAMHDVTAQQLAEQEVRRVNQELQRSNAELAQFAAVASHDLKSPLRTITSYLQLLERRYQGKLDAQGEQMISFTVEAAKRMDTLIDDLLAYSRLGRERRVRRVDAGQVLQDVLGNLDATIQELNAKVTWSDVPEVIADETQLRQVFQNLVANALKFQPPGRVPEVDVQAIREGDLVRFQVRDNGIGVDPAYFDRIFGIFQRLHGNKQFSGSGIGLAVVKKIIEEHDGSIWVESVVGEGTTFHFTLPVT